MSNTTPRKKDLGYWSERLMSMDDATWARHANPWSGWTRVATLPLLALAIWSRVWIGHWAWCVIAAVVLWTWINPRLFPEPKSLNNWMSQGVLGERIWLARHHSPIPAHHQRATFLLNLVSALALAVMGYGLWQLDIGFTVAGVGLSMMAKLWFLDRVVWLKQDKDGVSHLP